MTAQSFPISSVGRDPTRNLDVEDDLSTATPLVGYRNSDSDHEMVSKTIRFNFAPVDSSRIDSIDPADVHTQWLRIIASSFGNDVKIISNHNKPVSNISNHTMTANRLSHERFIRSQQEPIQRLLSLSFIVSLSVSRLANSSVIPRHSNS